MDSVMKMPRCFSQNVAFSLKANIRKEKRHWWWHIGLEKLHVQNKQAGGMAGALQRGMSVWKSLFRSKGDI